MVHQTQSPRSTMDFTLQQRWVVTRNQSTWILETKDVQVTDNNVMTFVHLEKWNRQFVKFSTGKYLSIVKGCSKQFSQSSCVDILVSARQAAADRALIDALRSDEGDDADAGRKRKRQRSRTCKASDLLLINTILDINVAGQHGGSFRCLAEGLGTKAVWLELSQRTLQWIMAQTQHDENSGDINGHADQVQHGMCANRDEGGDVNEQGDDNSDNDHREQVQHEQHD
jgi:hypothetical protein